MKTLIGIIVVLAVVIGGYFMFKDKGADEVTTPTGTEQGSTETQKDWKKYTDPSGSVSVNYPSFAEVKTVASTPTQEWKVDATKANGTLLADIRIPKTYMTGTNFSDARFTIGRSADAGEITNCTAVQDNFSNRTGMIINGYPFIRMTTSDAGAGNRYDTTSYHGIFDGDCYVIEYTIHSTNLANYPKSQGIKEFNKEQIESLLEDMRLSVKFLISSD